MLFQCSSRDLIGFFLSPWLGALLVATLLTGCNFGGARSYEDCVLQAIADRNRSPAEVVAIQEACRQKFPPKLGTLLSPAETAWLQGKAGRDRSGVFSGNIYNPTDWTITTVEISLGPAGGDTLTRRNYRVTELNIGPRTTGWFSISFLDDTGGGGLDWAIERAWGRR